MRWLIELRFLNNAFRFCVEECDEDGKKQLIKNKKCDKIALKYPL